MIAEALAWALLHSLWQGTAIALALAMVLWTVKSSAVRYAAAYAAMFAMAACFGITFAVILSQPAVASQPIVLVPGLNGSGVAGVGAAMHIRLLDGIIPWIAPFWIAGVAMLNLHTMFSWTLARRLRTRGVCCPPDPWQQRLDKLRHRIRLSKPVTLLESCVVRVPVVIGHVRPLILMPLGLLAGLPASQMEAVLLHELAHIRRHDYLMNLLQTLLESLLFHHPATWWISRVIREEREHCCDDLVVATLDNPHEYAVALTALEQQRWAGHNASIAATGGNLVKRIRRLLKQPEVSRRALSPIVSAVILTLTAALALSAWQSQLLNDSPYAKWVNEDVVYIIQDSERTTYLNLRSDPERDGFIEQFWLRRDPTPQTAKNESKEEHYRRIKYANDRFKASQLIGWRTDRGHMYIAYGPPDEIESHPAGSATKPPLEQWLYYHIEGRGNNVMMDFVDAARSGDYRMTMDPH